MEWRFWPCKDILEVVKKTKIGLDFDGVVAYNPFRIIRAPIKWLKREVLGIRKLTFFVPKNNLERLMWTLVHESSLFPGDGISLLKSLMKRDDLEFHLITARFGFLEKNLRDWLKRNGLENKFASININHQSEQPHLYKQRVVESLKLDYFVEDNLDIVDHLVKTTKTQVFWICNIIDMRHKFQKKFMSLRAALVAMDL